MPAPQAETSLVEREIRIEADSETVFGFFTDPQKMVRWLGIGATLDPRPGGTFRINTITDYTLEGEYLTVEPPRHVVFTWGFGQFPDEQNPLPPGSSTVEVTLVPDGDATVVRVSHRVPTELVEFHTMGWEHYLGRLGVAAEGGDPGPDPFADALEQMVADE